MEERTMEEAYAAFCAGDKVAFDEIMRKFQQGLIYFLQGYVHSFETAEDLAEDTFVDLLLHPGRFRGQSSLKTYLFSVARHKAIDHIRHEQRHPAVGLEEVAERRDDTMGPEERLLAAEHAQEIEAVLETLPEEYREVLRLLHLERFTYEETARVMKKSRKQIDNMAYRARSALRAALGKEGIVYEGL
ncbi:MAG: sigma-70 family RNA polymerase sigma factor [Oscillospiraceae bacterium]|nr:sigma-70 family RNA polymerase sigma factor [Oscillospiraceae bacterium]